MVQNEFEQIIKTQDELISALGVEVWVGMEPTFTRRFTETQEWLSEALGPEKLHYAYALLKEICKRQPGGVILHTLGRQYAGEELPRWSIGYYQSRNGRICWDGPPDPCLVPEVSKNNAEAITGDTSECLEAFWHALNEALGFQPQWHTAAFRVDAGLRYRLLFRHDGIVPVVDIDKRPQLARDSVHEQTISLNGLTDDLAVNGDFLLCLDTHTKNSAHYSGSSIVIELPELPNTMLFLQLLQCIAQAARQASLEHLVIQGFPPPVDAGVAWMTITPDPAVIEINQAPADNGVNFYRGCKLLYQAAQEMDLHPYRLHYNGVVSDSGGGGQFTLGGSEPLSSPFFRYPHLLARLIRYFNAHPSLSYWFAPPYIGGSSQSPRTDEGKRESFRELSVALEQLEKTEKPLPEFIWRSLSPFLVDPSGNPHRSELNIEKLWNPFLPGRGCLGLVEFRAFRMLRSSESAVAVSLLLRSLVAMLSTENKVTGLINHGNKLHDKYALPYFLQADLQSVFMDLQQSGLTIHDDIKSILLREPVRFIGKADFQGCCIDLHQALEFWPLVGDVASQEGGGSRLVDASTTRLQITIRGKSPHATKLKDWELLFNGYRVPLRLEQDERGPIKITGLRYRNFLPNIGLHPGIEARNSISLELFHHSLSNALQITYYEWHPRGLAYPGLPENMEDAANRRAERFTAQVVAFNGEVATKTPPDESVTDYCLDLRLLP